MGQTDWKRKNMSAISLHQQHAWKQDEIGERLSSIYPSYTDYQDVEHISALTVGT